jgi:hypothetical protein
MTNGRHARLHTGLFIMRLIATIDAASFSGAMVVLGVRNENPVYLGAACLACVLTMLSTLA